MENTWDYKVGDLVEVKWIGWPPITVVITQVNEPIPGRNKYWSYVGVNGFHRTFSQPGDVFKLDLKIKMLAKANEQRKD